MQQEPGNWDYKQHGVEPVEDTAVSGDEGTGIFHAQVALDEALG